ncbi:type II toxin-antitoxin system HicB family antitoxin [Mesorhizobium sp. Root695]|uniref:type II toxin-antitoxin system HicB family antitoxin n=1 Tax=Mesorhizobium sp. Root695 TaxID=1736589 RepID=UPI0009E84BDF|nr:type II toxin-antitoxin system HicB family antitoxin [Mesorhizobium sp. Root695]
MKNYLALIEKDPDSAFGIRFPDIPGCVSAADGAEDIVPNAVKALQLWADDMPSRSRLAAKRLSHSPIYGQRSPKEAIWSWCRTELACGTPDRCGKIIPFI